MDQRILRYYRTYLSYLFSFTKIRWYIKKFFGEVKRDTVKHLQWETIFESQTTQRPAKVWIGDAIFKAFPCGCEKTYYETGEIFRSASRCNNKNHQKRYWPYR